MNQKTLEDFPLLEEYRKHFKLTDRTIIAYDNCVYCNYQLSADLWVHELKHIERQNKLGVDSWVKLYLTNDKFRRTEEEVAYLAQLRSISDKGLRRAVRLESAKTLSSALYGNLCTYQQAFNSLK